MIAGLKGRIERKLDDAALIDVGGVIYRVNTSLVTLEDIGETGESARLFTHLYVREDQLTLYGFASPDELRLFETLIGVSGVGPRLALAAALHSACRLGRTPRWSRRCDRWDTPPPRPTARSSACHGIPI
ncbi:MAG: Holliday junction helicase RuvA [Thermomicrobiales bacterium]|nr:Holliday junction helicase RuvA [Thermomicrobiales bacterium]